MKKYILFFFILINLTLFYSQVNSQEKEYRSPLIFEKDILEFENTDIKQKPKPGSIVFIGSSSIRGWHKHIQEDLSPLTIIPRGFGGSNFNDAFYYADRIVISYKPRAVVIYEGDNDVAQGISTEKIANTFIDFTKKIHSNLPEARIYFISIKPSISRWHLWNKMKEANKLIEKICSKDKRLNYIDIASSMLSDDGLPKKELFLEDKLHLTRAGYILWRDIVKSILIPIELDFEFKK